MCEYAETAALVDVLDERLPDLRNRLSDFTNTELLTFFRQVRELGLHIEDEYLNRRARPATPLMPLTGRHHRG